MFEEKHATLEDMLEARDARVSRQRAFLEKTGRPLISMTLNMAGPVKRTRLSFFFFQRELKNLEALLQGMKADFEVIVHSSHTGDEALLAVHALSAVEIKRFCVDLEEHAPYARLLDLDVIDEKGLPLNRESLQLPERRCLVCEQPASVCASRAAHDIKIVQAQTEALLSGYARMVLADDMASLAMEASAFELMVHPKPGLVTAFSQGSHRDMDRFTFIKSQSGFLSYYRECFDIGWDRRQHLQEKAVALRRQGILAEARMNQLTGGVNTHRGWIYLSGILLAVTGDYLASMLVEDQDELKEDALIFYMSQSAAQYSKALERSLEEVPYFSILDHHMNQSSLITGIRKEAVNGFPSLFTTGLQVLKGSLDRKEDENTAGQRALLAILSVIEDTTLVKRAGEKRASMIIRDLRAKLGDNELESIMEELVLTFSQYGLNAGGAADLLAGSRHIQRFLDCAVTDL
jgi:holo-ACP synthase/triphosphoribosyl-dephospho-CoA synthase